MAENTKTATVEERLKALYKLQTILSEIDRIRLIRGELPIEVQELEDEIAGLMTRIDNFNAEIEEARNMMSAEKAKIANAQNLIAKYQNDLDNVRNNHEFNMLTKELEFQNLEIELAEQHMGKYNMLIDNKTQDIEATRATLEDREHILAEKKEELEAIVKETRQKEEGLRAQALAIEPTLDDDRLLQAFKRIRKNARNGLGVVAVERNACGGCFNRIPPQKQMEIKMHKKVIVCEYCGRILIDPELAAATVTPAAE